MDAIKSDLHAYQIDSFADYLTFSLGDGNAWIPGTFTLEDVSHQIECMRCVGELNDYGSEINTEYDWTTVTPEELYNELMNREPLE